MTDAVRRYSVLNRWFVFRRRSERRPSAPTAVPAPPVGLTEVVSEKVSELGPRPRTGENKVLLPAVAGAGGPLSPIEEGAAEMPSLTITEKSEEKVSKDYFINPTASDDARLGPALADWPRYLSLAAQVEIVDLGDATIRYPSIEAAIASAKFQKATDKAALGPQIFRVEGSIHQSYVRKRESLAPPALPKSIEDESTAVRVASSPGKIKAYGAVWNPEAWTAQKMDLYRAYLQQRFTADARFREMIVAIKEKGGNILFVNGTDANELGVGVRKDGSLAGGENKIGKLMQILA